jgi:hypothetical protein
MSHRPAACLAAAAALLAAAPALAAAHDRGPAAAFSVSVALPPVPPPWVVASLPPPAPGPWVQVSPAVHYGWLDANRAAFIARWGWSPWRVARHDGWYRGYPARGHGYGNGWARGHDRDD